MSAHWTERDESAVRFYLDALAGGSPQHHFLELRYRVNEDQFCSEFFSIANRGGMVSAIAALAQHTDVYVGCAPRTRHAGGKDAVHEVWTLWAECDGSAAAAAAIRFRPSPAIIVASGSGPNVHAYWPLDRALSPRKAEEANYRLANALGADLVCYDAARILRPPSTWNYKHVPPSPVRLCHIRPGLTYDLSDVVDHLPPATDERVTRRWQERPPRAVGGDRLLRIPPRVYVEDLLGARPGRNGKVPCPFHRDERPSLHVYPTAARGWCCFSCGRGGTIYDLAAGLWGLDTRGRDFIRVRTKLIERFGPELSRFAPGRTL